MQVKAKIKSKRNKGQNTLEGMDIPEIETPQSTVEYEHFDLWRPLQVESGGSIDGETEISPTFPFAWSSED